MSGSHSKPARAAVVVAHPDDEILWLSSVFASADQVILCFGDPFGNPKMAAARRRAVAALPLPSLVNLALPESGAGFLVDWAAPQLAPAGLKIADGAARLRYQANYPKLVAGLRDALAGCGDVYTHNPWGEYGHAEHVQVHRAVVALQAELGYTVWFSNYIAARSWPLARLLSRQIGWAQRRLVEPDLVAARRLMRIYLRHGAWTWTRFHRWPSAETLYAQPSAETATPQPLLGEWLLDVAGLRWWPPPWRPARRRLE